MGKADKEFHTFRGYQLLKKDTAHLTPSMEDYLEMIYRYCKDEGYIRIYQISQLLNVQAPSATRNVQKLADMGLVDYEKYGIIKLTEEGEKIGQFLLERHMLIESFLSKIGISTTLLKDTEMIEHNISMEALENIEMFNDFLENNPDIIKRFQEYKKNREC
ncbi:MAG: iron dependent repressor, metal binding and dimerization domain protein [Caldicoprobacterales bacterium]|jgi:DtxR family Mn-dependent transcriptional regulator|nr:DtxR family transcriptional regulator [Clostridiales bacterium]